MRQLYYTMLTLLRGHGTNIIKVVSLTLGLFIGIILLGRVAFELSYDTGYQEHDRLFIILSQKAGGKPGNAIRDFVPEVLMENFPDQIEAGTLVYERDINTYYVGDYRLTASTLLSDTLFFKTMGITVTSGEITHLATPGYVFVSEEFALRTFHTTDVIGKTLMRDKKDELTIRGTYRNVAENNSVRPDVIHALAEVKTIVGSGFQGYIRLKDSADVRKINERINVILKTYVEDKPENKGGDLSFSLEKMQKQHTRNPEVQRIIFVLSFLAIALLLISAMNYVLISISGLSKRIKGIGIHKCNGASSGQIFSMFFWETAIIVLISVIFVILFIVNLNTIISDLIEVSVGSLFTMQNLWVPILVILFIFLLSAVIPGSIYSNIPVTQLFQKYADHNTVWKKLLLFIQFAGVAFIFGISMVSFLQYKRVVNYNLGYDTEKMAVGYFSSGNVEVAATTLRNLPMVEELALSQLPVGNRYTMDWITDGKGEKLFLAGINWVNPDFIELHKFAFVEGRNIMGPNEVLVNEEFVRRMQWTDGAIGKSNGNDFSPGIIVGVLHDFVDNSLFESINPLFFAYSPSSRNITVKLREPFRESLENLNREVLQLFPTSDIIFTSFDKRQTDRYLSVRRFRDSAGVAFAAILVIALIGLFGYINDEIQRRSKEIGIRKVNGAQAGDILQLLNRDIIIVSLPAIIIGTFLSYFIGREWLGQFSGTQINLNIPFYVLLIIIMALLIIISVVVKSWRIANDNPVNSIRNE